MLLRTFLSTITLAGLLCLSGCMVISPFEASSAQIMVFRSSAGAQPVAQPAVALSTAQRHFIQDWLAQHRAGWSARYAATLTPEWCLRLDSPQDNSLSLCRYGATVVLRGLGPEMERTLTTEDQAQFAREIES